MSVRNFTHSHVWTAPCKQCVHIQPITLLDDAPRDKSSLRETYHIDLLASEIIVGFDLATSCSYLPVHFFENRGPETVTNFDAFAGNIWRHFTANGICPVLRFYAGVGDAVEDHHWSDVLSDFLSRNKWGQCCSQYERVFSSHSYGWIKLFYLK